MTEIRREFPPSRSAPGLAREALDGWLSEMVGEQTANDVRTVATELIGNAVRFGRLEAVDKIVVSGTIDDVQNIVRLDVQQPTPLSGAILQPNPKEFGMGLRIVDGLATRWGIDEGPPGVVWFEVDA